MRLISRKIWGPLGVTLFGVLAFTLLTLSRAEIKETKREPLPPLVQVMEAKRGDWQVTIPFTGELRAESVYSVSSQVSGRVTFLHPSLHAGGRVARGEVLVELQDDDFRLRLEEEQAKLSFEEAEYELEQGRARSAALEVKAYQKEGYEGRQEMRLAMREPQLKQIRSRIELQKSRVEQARLDLDRCQIVSPGDCVVLEKSVAVGDFVAESSVLARLADRGKYEIEARLPRSQLSEITLEQGNRWYAARIQDLEYEGHVVSYLGEVDSESRRSGVLIRVSSPAEKPLAQVGTFVEGVIYGKRHRGIVSIPESALLNDSRVMVVGEGGLVGAKPVSVKSVYGGFALLDEGLEAGDYVVLGNVSMLQEGAKVRTVLAEETQL